ncbi:UDP-glucuronosyltransferase-like [Lytechinus pictus]|uniref:UDP-glucuronosyltransferase-like n=1 Tax=Lytechinus pictus TaxID=7653 RepID=UPI0030B9F33E
MKNMAPFSPCGSVLQALAVFGLLILSPELVSGGKVLMNALLGEGSHFYCMAAIGESLVRQNHSVTMLISNAFEHRAKDEKYSHIFAFEVFNHTIPLEDVHGQFDAFNRRAFSSATLQMRTLLEIMKDGRAIDCDTILGDQRFMNRLRDSSYDILVYDLIWYCGPLIAKSIGIPYLTLVSFPSPCTYSDIYLRDGSMNPSYVPEVFSGFTNKMTFGQRILNVLQTFLVMGVVYDLKKPYEELIDRYNITEDSIADVMAQNELFLMNTDFAHEFPCPLHPKLKPVGGLTTRPSAPLSPELETFMESSGEHGVIVCTTGTYFTDVPIRIVKAFSEAFAQLPQKVVWQLAAELDDIPNNVRVLPWIPQNDILGHPKTKVLLYQGGNNGFFEAIYHAVPLVTFPIHADQYDVGARVVARGIGRNIDKTTITADVLLEALQDVISNSSYRQAMNRVSAIFHDRPQRPADRAAFWVEHAMKHGGSYLDSTSYGLNYFQRNLIDVFLFIGSFLCAVCWLLYRILKAFISFCIFRVSRHRKSE